MARCDHEDARRTRFLPETSDLRYCPGCEEYVRWDEEKQRYYKVAKQ